MTLGWLVCHPHVVHALPLDLNKHAEPQSHYQSPEDLIDMIPVLNQLPRNFIWGRGYVMKVSGQTLRIDHRIAQATAATKRTDCTIGFSYVTPVAGFFTSRIDLPLFYSQTPNFSSLAFNSMGDYVTSFSRGVSDNRSLRFVVSAKF
jgi:hypothetical protein